MRAVVIKEARQVDVMTLEDPAPGPRDVVVEVAACGICGTDLHILQGEFAPSLPIVPGHEFAGVVVATGTDVGEITVGQRVAVDPSLYCNECYYCRIGRNNLLGAHVLIDGSGTMGLMMLELPSRDTGSQTGKNRTRA
ncbi:MAG: alcohol dehydrogenase catalytic domain-containing protein [Streptosporangiaceae bacterium]|jgi:D-arabinose 1-dehydrogenase-like Zn-dependent alcohol dehydrogenase